MGRDCRLRRRVLLRSLCAGAAAWPRWLRAADDGVTADAVTISRVIALEGPAGAKGREQEASRRVAELIAAARAAGVPAVFMTLSNNSSAGFARELGVHARGVIVSQVTPPPGNHGTVASRKLRRLLADRPEAEVSYAAMEAYLSAKVLVEGLKRAGPGLTREAFVQALESLRRHDLGGIEIGYGPGRRTGSAYVELSILTEDGKYRR